MWYMCNPLYRWKFKTVILCFKQPKFLLIENFCCNTMIKHNSCLQKVMNLYIILFNVYVT